MECFGAHEAKAACYLTFSRELFLLMLEPVFDGFSFGRLHFWRSFFEHGHEPLHFFGSEWMTDVCALDIASGCPFGVDDQIALGIREREEGESRFLTADFDKHLVAAGVFKVLLGLAFQDDEVDQHEIFFQDRLDFWGLDKLIESFAPSSPGSAKDDEQIFLFGGCFGFCLRQKLLGGRRSLSHGCRRDEDRCQNGWNNFRAHGRTMEGADETGKEN